MNLSLEVARIIMPEYEWNTWPCSTVYRVDKNPYHSDLDIMISFDHTTPEALGQMAVWLANKPETYKGESFVTERDIISCLTDDNPNEALARAIIATQGGE